MVPLWLLFLVFGQLSLLAVGGANAVVHEMYRLIVDQHGWLNGRQFADLYAIAQSAPGPNVLVASLIGWQLAGIPGAAVSLVGICGPSSLLAYHVSGWWQRWRERPLVKAMQRGFAPVSIGLVMGGAWMLATLANHHWAQWLLCGVCALLSWRSNLNPLWLLCAGALLGWSGLV